MVDHDERRRRRALRGAARVAARRIAAFRTGCRAAVRLQRLPRLRGLQPAAASPHPGQALRPRARRHPARSATLGIPPRCSYFLQPRVPHWCADLLQPSG